MKRLLLVTVIILLVANCSQAFELDTSVDEEIRRNYNPSALEKQLPALPKVAPTQSITTQTQSPPKTLSVTESSKPQIVVKKLSTSQIDKSTAIRIKKGTKFKVKSNAYLSDSTSAGARFSFITLQPVTQRYVTLPAGTIFGAVVTNSHTPQISGNGGLLEITVDSLNYNGQTYYANAKVTKVNHKKVFLNNIKGKRQYWKNVGNQVDKGDRFYKKTRNVSNKLSGNPVGTIVAPIPTIVGTGAYAINLVASPIVSVASKGCKLSIPAGTEFEIKLLEDVYLY